jgi:hypothetical protein
VLLRTTKAVDQREANVEETIGYEALFSTEEWHSLLLANEEAE